MKKVIELCRKKEKTISVMESCTGGGVMNAITNIEGASDVFSFGAVTYSNLFKIKMGVSADIIEKYSVYSPETADEMSRVISSFSGSSIGIGITGKLGRADQNNLVGDDSLVFISIYDKDKDITYPFSLKCLYDNRPENKEFIIHEIEERLMSILE